MILPRRYALDPFASALRALKPTRAELEQVPLTIGSHHVHLSEWLTPSEIEAAIARPA